MSLGETWKSTNKIASESGVNWYRAEYILNKLSDNNMVQRDEKESGVQYWKVKSEAEEIAKESKETEEE